MTQMILETKVMRALEVDASGSGVRLVYMAADSSPVGGTRTEIKLSSAQAMELLAALSSALGLPQKAGK